MEWIKVKVNKNNVVHETEKALLIKLVGNEFKFWIPKKLAKHVNGAILELVIGDNFEIELFETDKKFQKKNEMTVDVKYIQNNFKNVA